MSKQYLIDEDTLRELLYDSHKLTILERDGVDNWWGIWKAKENTLPSVPLCFLGMKEGAMRT